LREGPTPSVTSSADALHARDIAGATLLGVAGVGAVADLALWIVAAKKH
jgi:hypothetical protein